MVMYSDSVQEDMILPVIKSSLAARFDSLSSTSSPKAVELAPVAGPVADQAASEIATGGSTSTINAGGGVDSLSFADRLWNTKMTAWPGRINGDDKGATRDGTSGGESMEHADMSGMPIERQALVYSSDQLKQGDGSKLRTSALFINSLVLGALDTAAVLSLLSSVLPPPHPLGIEWVDDTNIVAVFESAIDAEAAFSNLADRSLDPSEPLSFHLIASITSDRLSQMGFELQPFFVRLAMGSDVRAKDAAKKSAFYSKQQQRSSRRSARSPYDRPGSLSDNGNRLDDELDAYARVRDGGSSSSSGGPKNNGRSTKKVSTKESLDEELDAFLRGE